MAVLPFLGLAKRCPIKTRETAGFYGAGLTIDVPEPGTSINSLRAVTLSPDGLKNEGGSK
jgi:hypothetical protein